MLAPLSFVVLHEALRGYPLPSGVLRLGTAYSLLGALVDLAGHVGLAQVRWTPTPDLLTPATAMITLPAELAGTGHHQPATPLATLLTVLVGCTPRQGALLLTQIQAIDQAHPHEPLQARLTRLQAVWPGPAPAALTPAPPE